MSVFADDYLARLGPLAAIDPDDVLATFAAAGAAMVGRFDEIVEPTDETPGWSMLLDPDRVPAAWLPVTAALYGVTLITGSSEPEQRALIKDRPAQRRGGPDAMRVAVAATLDPPSPPASVLVLERVGGNAYAMTVVTRTAVTPDPAAAEAAARTEKPIGVSLTSVVSDDVVWAEATLTWDAVDPGLTWDDVAAGDV